MNRSGRCKCSGKATLGMVVLLLTTCHGMTQSWTLPQVVHMARTNSPEARLAEARILEARAMLRQSEAAFWPRLSIHSSYLWTDQPMRAFGAILNQRAYRSSLDFNDVPDTDHWNVGGMLAVPLYSGGRNRAGHEAAMAQTQAAQWRKDAALQTLSWEAVRTYCTIQKHRAFARAAEAAVLSLTAHVNQASNRVAGGTALRTEALELELHLAQAREDLVRAEHARDLSIRALRNLLGYENEAFEVAETLPPMEPPGEDERWQPERPELLALQAEASHAEAGIRQAQAGFKPAVEAFGALDYDRGWEWDGDGQSYTVGLTLQWQLWDGRLTRGKVRAAEARLEAIRQQERQVRLEIDFAVEQARRQYAEAAERLKVTEKSVEQATEYAALQGARFAQGVILANQMVDAETALVSARLRRAEAEADRRIAVAAWRWALGLSPLSEE